jgi:methylated-DNA-[protein]-cysteine S-methyltransferase
MLMVTDDAGNVHALDWDDHADRMHRLMRLQEGAVTLAPRRVRSPAHDAMAAYFAGDLGAITTVPVKTGGTPFQRDVWTALRAIPTGQTTTYGALAVRLGRPKAMRAVGMANGSNPVSIIVPCHRVIGADATLTGYGGGLARKRWLLRHEGAVSGVRDPSDQPSAPLLP